MKDIPAKLCGKFSSLVSHYLDTGKLRKNFLLHDLHRNEDTFSLHITISNISPETIFGEFKFSITKKTETCEQGFIYSPKNKKIYGCIAHIFLTKSNI